jgi:hypothetical protein
MEVITHHEIKEMGPGLSMAQKTIRATKGRIQVIHDSGKFRQGAGQVDDRTLFTNIRKFHLKTCSTEPRRQTAIPMTSGLQLLLLEDTGGTQHNFLADSEVTVSLVKEGLSSTHRSLAKTTTQGITDTLCLYHYGLMNDG